MKTFGYVVGALVLLLIVVCAVAYAMGSALPVSHVASESRAVAAPQARVWALISDVQNGSKWRTGLKSVEMLPAEGGHPCWLEEQPGMKMKLCEQESDPPSTRSVKIADPKLPFGGYWLYELGPAIGHPEASVLTISEHGEVYAPMWRFVSHYIMGDSKQLKQFQDDVAKAVAKP